MASLRLRPTIKPVLCSAILVMLATGLRVAPAQTASPSAQQVKGFGVIEKVLESAPEPLYEADGYRIRISAASATQFSGKLKSLSDVAAGNWIRYEAKRSPTGEVIADHAEFVEGLTGEKKPADVIRASSGPDVIPTNAKLIDADGRFLGPHTKYRMSDASGACGWYRLSTDTAMQARVWRVGMRIVPDYQKNMAPNSAEQIRFRFYAIDEPKFRSELVCNPGIIVIPQQAVSRLTTDDQLAAVLADGVAANLQWQACRLSPDKYLWMGLNAAEVAAEFASPWAFIGIEGTAPLVNHELMKRLEEQRGRMALAMMTDAGYDPWAAPEAWRQLAPKNLPANPASLKYPARSEYQRSILNSQYKNAATTTSSLVPSP